MESIAQTLKRRNRRQSLRIFFGRGVIMKICFALLMAFILMAVFAPLLAPHDPNKQNLVNDLKTPTADYLLGTDYLGRDVLSRVIYGARMSLSVSILSGTLAAAIGILLGLVAGYFGGSVSSLILGAADVVISIPEMVFALVIAAALGGGIISLVIAIGIGMVPSYIRMMNGLVVSLKENDYVLASRLLGRKERFILFKHLLPNAFPSLIVLYTINLGNAIMTESTLSFLGVGIMPPTATWGNMVSDAYQYLLKAPWLAIIPGVCIILLIISFNVVGDGLRDALDPRLRGKI